MSFPFRRRSDHFSSPHERARTRAAERLDGPLGLAENEWLDRHLAECSACRAVADAYLANRSELRSLGRQPIEPPRDLWARTSAAIEVEASAAERRRGAPAQPRRRPSPVPLGALAGLMVVAVVFGATLLSGRPGPSVTPRATDDVAVVPDTPPPAPSDAPAPTPWVVGPNDIDWVAKADDGTFGYFAGEFDEVCDAEAICQPLDSTPRPLDVPDAPKEAIISDNEMTLAVINRTSDGGDSIVVVPVPTPQGGTGGPSEPPPSASPTTGPAAETPSVEPSGTPPASPLVTAPPASPEPAGPIEIADDVIVVGETAFSADGSRFAFSARPADGSAGPDIYVWSTGDEQATPITSGGRSVFAGWLGDLILASRAVDEVVAEPSSPPEPSGSLEPSDLPAAAPETFVIDPLTGAEALVEGAMWRPAVDPTGTWAVYWDGTVQLDAATGEYRPAAGRLVVGAWSGVPVLPAEGGDPDASAVPSVSAEPVAPAVSVDPSASAEPVGRGDVVVLHDGPVVEWEARWDQSGERLGLWIQDAEDPTIGRLSLYLADDDGALAVDEPALSGEWARPGFAIGEGHLAWATKAGQDGKGSHVRVVAWTEDGIGKVETKPGEDVLVVQH